MNGSSRRERNDTEEKGVFAEASRWQEEGWDQHAAERVTQDGKFTAAGEQRICATPRDTDKLDEKTSNRFFFSME